MKPGKSICAEIPLSLASYVENLSSSLTLRGSENHQ